MPYEHNSKIYHQLSHWYDRIFVPLFQQRLEETIRSQRIEPGARVLEVGVGTGLSLGGYPRHAEVVGIDLADGMLAQARAKVEEKGWDHISLHQMDALQMDFPDEHFDYVFAFHVVSVVPDPGRLVQEISRVTRLGGSITIVNHFRSEKKWLAPLVDMLNPVTRRLGWRTDLRYTELVDAAPLNVERRFKHSAGSLFTVVVGRRLPGTNSAISRQLSAISRRSSSNH